MHTRLFTRILPFALVLGGNGFARPAEDEFNLSRKAVKGDSYSYLLTIDTTLDGFPVKIKGTTAFSVVEILPDGTFIEKVEDMGTEVDIQGTVVDIPPQPFYRQKTSSNGSRIEYLDRPFKSDDARVAQTSSFPFPPSPVKLKESWKVSFPGDPKIGSEKAEGVYTVVEKLGAEGAASVKIEFTYKETASEKPIEANGYMIVRLKDGLRTKMEFTARNVPIRAGKPPSEVKTSYELVP